MKKRILIVGISLLLVASACAGDEPEAAEETPTQAEESPSSDPLGTFQLQGRILETVASAEGDRPGASPSPTGSPAGTPAPEAEDEAETEDDAEATPTAEAVAIERGAPGSMSIRLSSYTGEATSCVFEEGDTVAVVYTSSTSFTPPELAENERFPSNLRETNVNVQGRVLDEESCILVADSVGPQIQGQAAPTPTGDSDESPSPTASPSPSPTR